MDITNREGTITYHIKPTDRVKLHGRRGWWFVGDSGNVNDPRIYKKGSVVLTRTSEERDAGEWEEIIDPRYFCDLIKKIQPSLEADYVQ